ncbi:hypothetical protein KIL84_014990 [Mauremys mutica]|uniref:Uncharacterized protein n=1 Tax=Mauremys mutica TaxID=74926 RepID=A0A9D3XMR6_9SAUR|nr:hypothetical protein KIL84_014990 [Mauremys mutica]
MCVTGPRWVVRVYLAKNPGAGTSQYSWLSANNGVVGGAGREPLFVAKQLRGCLSDWTGTETCSRAPWSLLCSRATLLPPVNGPRHRPDGHQFRSIPRGLVRRMPQSEQPVWKGHWTLDRALEMQRETHPSD